jgi:hypothetical protein
VDDDSVLQNIAAPLQQVQSIDRARMTVLLGGPSGSTIGTNPARHPMLRRWDEKAGDPALGGLTLGTDNAALIFPQTNSDPRAAMAAAPRDEIVGQLNFQVLRPQNSPWFELEDGVQVQFTMPPQTNAALPQFRTGDYWLIPARVATGNVEWPVERIANAAGQSTPTPLALPPEGVTHHYAPIALITVAGNTVTVNHSETVVFGPGGGVLGFVQDAKPYGTNGFEEILTAPVQTRNVEMVARPKATKAKAQPKAAEEKK